MKKNRGLPIKLLILTVLFAGISCFTLFAVGQKEKPDETQPYGATTESQKGSEGTQAGSEESKRFPEGNLELRDSIELEDAVLRAEDLMQKGRFREADAVLVRGPIPRDKKKNQMRPNPTG